MNPYYALNTTDGKHGHHHHGHHHHGHHGHHGHHSDPQVIVMVASQGFNANPFHQTLFNPNQEYIIESGLGHDMVLDISQDKKNLGQLIIWKKHGKKNQRFRIVEQNGRYQLLSCFDMQTVSVQNNGKNDGEPIFTHHNGHHMGQMWEFVFVKDKQNSFYIKNGHDKFVDVFKGSHSKGTPVIQWKFNGNKNQIWNVVPA